MADAIPVVKADVDVPAPSDVKEMAPVKAGPSFSDLRAREAKAFAAASAISVKIKDADLADVAAAAEAEGKRVTPFGNSIRVDN